MTIYPAQIDTTITLPLVLDNTTSIKGETVNRLRAAIIALESELGVKPSGTYATVRARFDTIESLFSDVVKLGGDIGGTIDSPLVIGLQGRPLSNVAPSLNQVIGWNGVAWVPMTGGGGGGGGDVPSTRNMIAGDGLTGGGTLAADRTFTVGQGFGILVTTDEVAVDTTIITTKLYVDTADGYLTPLTRNLIAGAGLTGGGDLSADRTFNIGAGTGITVNVDDVAVDTSVIAVASRNIIAGAGLTGGGTLAADRTFDIGAGAGITVNTDNISIDETYTANIATVIALQQGCFL